MDLLTLFALTFSAISNHGGTGVWDCRAFAPIYTVHTTATVSHMVKTEPKVLAIWRFDIFDLRCSVWMSGIGEMSLWGALYMAAGEQPYQRYCISIMSVLNASETLELSVAIHLTRKGALASGAKCRLAKCPVPGFCPRVDPNALRERLVAVPTDNTQGSILPIHTPAFR